jgi:predicted methyltransferase
LLVSERDEITEVRTLQSLAAVGGQRTGPQRGGTMQRPSNRPGHDGARSGRRWRALGVATVLGLGMFAARTSAAADAAPTSSTTAATAAVAAADRDPADRALDAGRHPAETLAFFGIAPGMRVAELGAGGGYTSELLARTVGPSGKVYAQNSQFLLDRFAQQPWSERLKKPVMANVVRLDRPFDDPFPADVKDLDAVLIVLFYHDTYWQKVERAKMNAAVLRALKPGGVYGIVDHSAKAGDGAADVETLHRIEEPTLVADVEQAGFQLAASAEFLRNPADTRDWSASPRSAGEKRGTSDRFVLKFVKPAAPAHGGG